MELGPHLPATDLVRLPDLAANRNHRRIRLDREGGPVGLGLDEHERPRRRVHGLAVDLEPSMSTKNHVELLAARVLLVLGHQPIARFRSGPRVRPECRDPEVVPHRPHMRLLPVVDVLQLVDGRDSIAH